MRPAFRHLFLGLGTALLLAACGGGGDDGPRVAAPTASIAPDHASVEVGATVTVTATASSPSGGALTYRWSLGGKPGGSDTTLSGTSTKATFVPDQPGNYVVRLVVNDGNADSGTAETIVKATSLDPVANAGADSNTLVGAVQLDGTGSQPPSGGDASRLIYRWTLVQVPDGSKAMLDQPGNVRPRFSADVPGVYRASLVVAHGERVSKADEVTVNVVKGNVPAVVAFSVNGQSTGSAKVDRGSQVVLDASATYDPDTPADKSRLQYRWSFSNDFSGYGSTAVIENATTARAVFTPNVVGSVSVTLRVFDGISMSEKSVQIGVVKPQGEANLAPGVISPLVPYSNNTYEAELGAPFRMIGFGGAYDPDYSYPYPTYEWTWISYPAGWDPIASSVLNKGNESTFTPTVKGDYTIELRVRDAEGAISNAVRQTYTALLGANRAPTASAAISTGNTSTLIGRRVTLDGAGSTDPDGNRLTYAWTLLDRPDGSTAELQNANTDKPTLTPDKAGPYTAGLRVTDSHGFTSRTVSKVTLLAKSQNHAPTVRVAPTLPYSAEQPMVLGRNGMLEHTNSVTGLSETLETWNGFSLTSSAFDPDGDKLTYLWSVTQEPAGNAFKLLTNGACQNGRSYTDAWGAANNVTWGAYWAEILAYRTWDCADVSLAPSVPGNYTLELLAYDGTDRVGPFAVSVPTVARAGYPTLLLEQASTPTASDATGLTQRLFPFSPPYAPTFFMWSPISNPEEAAKRGSGVAYFRLTAYDRDYTITGVSASVSGSGFKPSFGGLADNQIVRKGESIVVALNLSVDVAAEPASGNHEQPVSWTFRVAERPDWTFQYQPSVFYFR